MTSEPNTNEYNSGPEESMLSAILPFMLVGVILLAVGASIAFWKWKQSSQPVQNFTPLVFNGPPLKLDDVELTERSGKPLHFKDMLGKVWVVSFFYTSCPGECEKLNRNIAAMNYDDDLKDIYWVSISVDPDTDTKEALTIYADRFKADPEHWLFCRGEMDYVTRLGRDLFKLGIGYKGHKSFGVVINKNGEIKQILNINSRKDRKRLKELLLTLQAEPYSPTESDHKNITQSSAEVISSGSVKGQ